MYVLLEWVASVKNYLHHTFCMLFLCVGGIKVTGQMIRIRYCEHHMFGNVLIKSFEYELPLSHPITHSMKSHCVFPLVSAESSMLQGSLSIASVLEFWPVITSELLAT